MVYQRLRESLINYRKFYLMEGILLLLAGVAAIALPAVTALAVNIVIAFALILGGVGRLLTLKRYGMDRQWKLPAALLLLITGILMLVFPASSISVLVLILAAFLILEGVLGIGLATSFWGMPYASWQLVSGILSLLVGFVILLIFPEAGMFYLALIVGISLMLSGLSLLMLIWNLRT